jgi:dUTPase
MRRVSYDATVGEIIACGRRIQQDTFMLSSRGVVWVISQEEFTLPDDITGLVTLRTTWAHEGVFALNVGVLDPGWKGPVATALVNFGRDPFEIKKGDSFFRVLFFDCDSVSASTTGPNSREAYLADIAKKSRGFSETFLNMSSLVDEISNKMFHVGRTGAFFAKWGLIVALLAIFCPIAYNLVADGIKRQLAFSDLQRRTEAVETRVRSLEEERKELVRGRDSPTIKSNKS